MKKLLIILLSFFLTVQSFGAALPAYSPKFGQTMTGVIEKKVAARGFAANDPRYIATASAIGTVMTAAAGGVIAAAGVPLWATIAGTALAAGAIALGVDALTKWIFNDNGTVSGVIAPVANPGNMTLCVRIGNPIITSCGGMLQVAWIYVSSPSGTPRLSFYSGCSVVNGSCYVQFYRDYIDAGGVPRSQALGANLTVYAPGSAPAGSVDVSSPVSSSKPVSDAVADIPESDMQKPANPQLVADSINKWWQQAAAQPDYQGLPYNYSDPVTSQDVQNYQSQNSASYPKVADFVAPAVNPATQTVTIAAPNAVIDPATGQVQEPGIKPASDATKVDLGVDPVIGAPNLEATPTASAILAPLLNLFPDLRSFVVPSHSASCPKPSMSMFGKTYALNSHCAMFESVRPTLYAVMAVVWVVLGVFIILAA